MSVGYRALGRISGVLFAARLRISRAGAQRGQGTVEYVALILLVAVVLAGVVAATRHTSIGGGQIGETIVKQLKKALDSVG